MHSVLITIFIAVLSVQGYCCFLLSQCYCILRSHQAIYFLEIPANHSIFTASDMHSCSLEKAVLSQELHVPRHNKHVDCIHRLQWMCAENENTGPWTGEYIKLQCTACCNGM